MPKITDPLCPICKSTSCYHCWECGVDLSSSDHHLFCRDYDAYKNCTDSTITCVACEGTGKNSKGNQCFPCEGSGIQPETKEKV